MPEREMHRLANKHQITPAEVARKHYKPKDLLKHTALQYLDPASAKKVFVENTQANPPRLEVYWDKVYLMTLPTDQIREHRDYISRVFPNDVISAELLAKSSETEQERNSALNQLAKLTDTSSQDVYTRIDAYNALDRLKPLPKPVLETLSKQLAKTDGFGDGFGDGYIDRLRQYLGFSVPKKSKPD